MNEPARLGLGLGFRVRLQANRACPAGVVPSAPPTRRSVGGRPAYAKGLGRFLDRSWKVPTSVTSRPASDARESGEREAPSSCGQCAGTEAGSQPPMRGTRPRHLHDASMILESRARNSPRRAARARRRCCAVHGLSPSLVPHPKGLLTTPYSPLSRPPFILPVAGLYRDDITVIVLLVPLTSPPDVHARGSHTNEWH